MGKVVERSRVVKIAIKFQERSWHVEGPLGVARGAACENLRPLMIILLGRFLDNQPTKSLQEVFFGAPQPTPTNVGYVCVPEM